MSTEANGKLDLKQVIAMGVGGMVGGGIFSVLGLAMVQAGHAAPIAFALGIMGLYAFTFGTEIAGTLIAVYGIFITPIGWEYALLIWAYALVWFLFKDVVKVGACRLLRRNGGVLSN